MWIHWSLESWKLRFITICIILHSGNNNYGSATLWQSLVDYANIPVGSLQRKNYLNTNQQNFSPSSLIKLILAEFFQKSHDLFTAHLKTDSLEKSECFISDWRVLLVENDTISVQVSLPPYNKPQGIHLHSLSSATKCLSFKLILRFTKVFRTAIER